MIIATPNNAIITTANIRRTFGSRWRNLIRYEIERVKIVKLSMIPRVIPRGLLCPPLPATLVERTMGRRGQMQGARIVTRPDKNANVNKIIII